jgi:hypothetical protein
MMEAQLAAPTPIDRTATIAILTHALQELRPGTTIARIAHEHWVPKGHRIVIHRGLENPPPADVAIQHVDLTKVPPAYLDLARHYPRMINAAVDDISKKRVSAELLCRDSAYAGPVMVKTDLNHAGMPERMLRREMRGAKGALLRLIERAAPCTWFGHLPNDQYVVFEHKDAVPGWVWRARGLVVQPLYMERRGDLFALNQWYFLGDRDCVSTLLSRAPVVKIANVAGFVPLHREVPDEIRRRREELAFDYGKFDYVIVDGRPMLLDANRTPDEGPAFPTIPRIADICAALAPALAQFLD